MDQLNQQKSKLEWEEILKLYFRWMVLPSLDHLSLRTSVSFPWGHNALRIFTLIFFCVCKSNSIVYCMNDMGWYIYHDCHRDAKDSIWRLEYIAHVSTPFWQPHIICCIVALTKMLWIQSKGWSICTSFSKIFSNILIGKLGIHIVVNLSICTTTHEYVNNLSFGSSNGSVWFCKNI